MTPEQAKLATKQLVRDMVEAFGADRAAKYISLGFDWSQAVAEHCQFLAFENEQLRERLALLDQAERTPLSQGGCDLTPQARRQGFVNKIEVRQ